ncbi:RNA polymerase sigma-70 factor, ECF subfamily [Pedobacter sp. ok626]|uniref:RNA polymerase sigma-70 factor n=1 Tax=Pedobacter sp. ok626 TaxID=1761882 RepID=UPI0008924D43|nr:RNA polymerase sigma-70 factor [Pedobacter sp. ok626]SDL10777.1 RNA polymerase sigma-70 factor, ECF subfamily [Pedobacter sp. ok626]
MYKPEQWSDENLLMLVRDKDDRNAFAELYRRHWRSLLDSAYQRLKSVESAEEIVQDIFVSLFLRRKELVIQSSLEVYLKSALRYSILNIYRTHRVKEQYVGSLRPEYQNKPETPDSILETKELREKIMLAAAKMPDKCREVFMLSRFDQLSQRDIAIKLDISVSTVKKHMTKAMSIIRAEIGDQQLDLILICLFVYFYQ